MSQIILSRGERTRLRILDQALDVASVEGLEGLTIGRLAAETGMSKAGLFAHFGSKEELQLATLQCASDAFSEQVLVRLKGIARGVVRLRRMLDLWVDYISVDGLRGGCFFSAVSLEFDDRPGRVREEVASIARSWMKRIEREIQVAVRAGELDASVDVAQLAFELHAMPQEANWARQLLDDPGAFDRARVAIDSRISAVMNVVVSEPGEDES